MDGVDEWLSRQSKSEKKGQSAASPPVASKRGLFVPGYKVLLPRGPRRLGATAVIDFFFAAKNKFGRDGATWAESVGHMLCGAARPARARKMLCSV